MAIPSGIIIGWPSTAASIPSGWSRETALDAKYLKGVPTAATNPGTTGGATTHIHTTPAHPHDIGHSHTGHTGTSSGMSGTDNTSGANLGSLAHTHSFGEVTFEAKDSVTDAPTSDSISSDPAYLKSVWIKSNGSPTGIPNNAICFFNSATFPTNWTQIAAGKNAFLKGADAAGDGGGTGGAATHSHAGGSHTHGGDHTHSYAPYGATLTSTHSATASKAGTSTSSNAANHLHRTEAASNTPGTSNASNISSSTDNHEPAWYKLAIIQNGTGSNDQPLNLICAWTGTISNIPTGWIICDGNNSTPNLLGKFIKGADATSEIGNTGGGATHTHTGNTHTHTWSSTSHTHTVSLTAEINYNAIGSSGSGNTVGLNSHTHTGSTTSNAGTWSVGNASPTLDSVNHEPPYYEVAFLQLQTLPTSAFPFNQVQPLYQQIMARGY